MSLPPDLEKSGSYVWANTFAKHLNAQGLTAKEYQRGALGEEAERLDQISQGLLQVSMSDLKSAAGLDSTMYGVNLPYLFRDAAHLDKALVQGGLLEQVNARLAKKGVRIIGIVHLGLPAGIFNTKKPVTSHLGRMGPDGSQLDFRQPEYQYTSPQQLQQQQQYSPHYDGNNRYQQQYHRQQMAVPSPLASSLS